MLLTSVTLCVCVCPPAHVLLTSASICCSRLSLFARTSVSTFCLLYRASWAYLHTMAAFYPEAPSDDYARRMSEFMLAYARFYPCGYCADTTSDEMVRNPPRTQSRVEFALWMCEIHNEVNDRLGKPQFDCSKVDVRWRKAPPDGRCG